MRRVICWWVGHYPQWRNGCYLDNPCELCKRPLSYDDLVNEGVWPRLVDRLRGRFRRCPDCGKRFGKHRDCLPF